MAQGSSAGHWLQPRWVEKVQERGCRESGRELGQEMDPHLGGLGEKRERRESFILQGSIVVGSISCLGRSTCVCLELIEKKRRESGRVMKGQRVRAGEQR